MMLQQTATSCSLSGKVLRPAVTPDNQLMCPPSANEVGVPTGGEALLQV